MAFTDYAGVADIAYYVKLIKEKALARALYYKFMAYAASIAEDTPPAEVLEDAEQYLFDAHLERNNAYRPKHISEVATGLIDYLGEKAESGDDKMLGLSTGIPQFDDRILGITKGITVIAANSSVGKTSMALNIAGYNAFDAGKIVLMYTAESDNEAIGTRILAN